MRRLFRFRLRTLFVLTTLAAVMCAAGIPAVERYREHQRKLVARKIEMLIQRRCARSWQGANVQIVRCQSGLTLDLVGGLPPAAVFPPVSDLPLPQVPVETTD